MMLTGNVEGQPIGETLALSMDLGFVADEVTRRIVAPSIKGIRLLTSAATIIHARS